MKTVLKHFSQTMFMKTVVHLLKTGFRQTPLALNMSKGLGDRVAVERGGDGGEGGR